MFNLLRRISGSVIPRPDRPWKDDATSSTPQIGRKRRLSSTEREPEQHSSVKKSKARSWGVVESDGTPSGHEDTEESPVQQKETKGVKEVTKGVKEVMLEDTSTHETSPSSSQHSPAAPPPESGVETEPLEADEDRDSERSTPEAGHVSETARVVKKDSSVPEDDVTAPGLVTSIEKQPSPVKASTLNHIHSEGVTDAEEVKAATKTASAEEAEAVTKTAPAEEVIEDKGEIC